MGDSCTIRTDMKKENQVPVGTYVPTYLVVLRTYPLVICTYIYLDGWIMLVLHDFWWRWGGSGCHWQFAQEDLHCRATKKEGLHG